MVSYPAAVGFPASRAESSRFQLFVASLPGFAEAGLPIAGSRAGALGLLDLRHLCDPTVAASEIDRLATLGGKHQGLILRADDEKSLGDIASRLPGADSIVLATGKLAWPQAVATVRPLCRRVGCLVHSSAQAEAALAAGADYLIARGYEAGGEVGEETTFVLLQRLLADFKAPIIAWGGIGFFTAAACQAAGAAGVVLDWQLALLPESPLSPGLMRKLNAADGSESHAVRLPDGSYLRFFSTPGDNQRSEIEAAVDCLPDGAGMAALHDFLAERLTGEDADRRLLLAGQDCGFAKLWAKRARSVGRAVEALFASISGQLEGAAKSAALSEGGPCAVSHGTRYPIVQGPMTRVSDVPEFCDAVERGGALPFLALALMRGDELRKLLADSKKLLGSRPWGVGILGFMPHDLRSEQLAAILEVKPPFAVIAGGRPDQAAAFEAQGITTYLHVPSPGMLSTFVAEGARRFVFEGRECGGHVGPRTSFVLWESMLQSILDAGLLAEEFAKLHVLFAGGIHDGRSAAAVAAMAQPLVERGAKIGALLGTAYLFTEEIVLSGATLDGYRSVAIEAAHTVLVETGPGHAIRCADTEYVRFFEGERQRLKQLPDATHESIRDELEQMNLGRLRAASKGIVRGAKGKDSVAGLQSIDELEQRRQGMYMLGQISALRRERVTIAALHEQVSTDYQKFLGIEPAYPVIRELHQPDAPATFDVAIVGMSCLVPGATDLGTFWRNVLGKKDLIGEIPPDRFEVDRWFNSDRHTRDKFYSRWGGFIADIPFDPLQFGIPPSTLKSIEPMQLLALELIRRAMLDAGYDQENPHRARTSVILGVGGGSAELGASYAFRAMLPQFIENPDETLYSQLPEWTEDSFAGILLNVVAGRASNRFDFGGANFTVDAACASSLAALYLACRELSEGSADMVVAGGCDTVQNPLGYLCFAKAGALSPRGRSRAFDASADGIAISEGHAAIVLKRREDAERNGDHIYAVIRAVAAGSDGRSKGLTAPRAEGQLRTLERAYAQARFSPATVDLFEAHGTGTAVGDQTECLALVELLEKHGALDKSAAIGSIKSMIGHTKCAAGMVGLVKTALALETHVLPPTLHVEKPNPKARLDQGPVYVNSDSRPWIRGEFPRRAGVSSFGFGGSNFHTVLEEYEGAARPLDQSPTGGEWPTELFAFTGNTAAALATSIRGTLRSIAKLDDAAPEAREKLLNLAASCAQRCSAAADVQRAALIAEDFGKLRERLEELAQLVEKQTPSVSDWLFYAPHRLGTAEQIAFLFPGQGSQSPNMLRDLTLEFGEVAAAFQLADRVLPAPGARSLSSYVFPPSSFTDEERKQTVEQLKSTDVAQPALGACALGLQRLLAACGLRPAATAGHSYGELAAFQAAGAYDEATLLRISAARGRAMAAAGKAAGDAGQMRVVRAGANEVQAALAGLPDVWIANYNSPRQVVISGTTPGVAAAVAALDQAKLASVAIPVACAFHTPLVRPASEQLATAINAEQVSPPRVPVYSNVSAAAWTGDAQGVGETLAKQVESPVRFAEMIRAMYDAGTRLFVEVGPGQVLSGLVKDTLSDRPHLALPVDGRGVHGLTQLQRVLCQTFVHGAPIRFDRLFAGRIGRAVPATPDINNLPKHYWLINSAYVRPASEPARIPSPKARLGGVTAAPAIEPVRELAAPSQAVPAESQAASAAPTIIPVSPSTQPAMSNGSPAPRFQPPAPTPAPIEPIAADDAYGAFQATMRHFLDTQRAVMGAFFGASPEPVEHAPRAIEYHAHTSTNGSNGSAIHTAPVAPAALVPVPTTPVATSVAVSPHPVPSAVQTPTAAAPAAPAPAVVVAQELDLPALLIGIVSDRTGYPSEMLELETNLEADLGIDSIKRVEIIAAFRRVALPEMKEPPSAFMERMTAARNMRAIVDTVREFSGVSATVAAAPTAAAPVVVAQAAVSVGELETLLAGIVAERTGYPTEMLEMETNLEADLGIDSIKRVEIIAAFRRVALPEMKEPPSAFMERMTAARNMRAIVDTVREFAGGVEVVSPAPVALQPVAQASAGLSAAELEATLVGIVAERTGYPPEMLEMETNLEADLGIDSIKRVEIIAAFRRVALPEMKEPPSAFMERMTAARNMRAIVDTVLAFSGDQPASAPIAAASVAVPVAAPAVSVAELESLLVGIVAERTGYPPEMLEMETNLEADLGIDSIKRVEIIAAFRRVALPEMKEPPSAFMERMTAARNMRTIVDTVLEFSGSSDPAPVVAAPVSQPAAKPSAVVPPLAESAHCDRCVAAPVECEPAKLDSAALRQRVSAGVTLVAGGPHALAAAVRERIERAGGVVALLPEELLRSPEALLAGIETIRRDQGRIVGALHLAGLTDAEEFPQISEVDWLERCRIELRSLLPLLQALQAELAADAHFPVLAATLGGGDFLADGADEARHPWRGGAAGFIKTAAKEWPEALIRAVDFDLQPEAETLLAEWLAKGPVEIGYRRGHRWTIAPVLSNLPQLDADVAAAAVELDSKSLVLATGGARGITAQIVLEIAERTQATCVLLGRSPLPASVESPSTANLSDPMALRQALIVEAKASGKPASPREIEAQLRSLLAARELRETLGGIQRAGGQVDYIPCDVRDVDALLGIVQDVRRRYGRIDCVIHGAGVIEDRYIRDKTIESFDRVIDTKVRSLLTICRELDDAPPKQLVIFSSSSGFFGNPGQCDYAAGNEILNRLGRRLQARWPAAHVMSFNWGPWTGAGMVTPEVAHQMQTRGVELVTVPAGRSLVWREMVTGRNEGVRIVGGSGFWTDEAKTLAAAECALPLSNSLLPNRVRRTHADCFEAHVTLDADSHAYLADHQLDGKPVLPFAVALEMMAQTAAAAEPRWHVVAVEQLRLFQGVVLEETHRQLVLRADLLQRSATRSKWRVRMIDPMAGARPLYEANISLASEAPIPPAAPEPPALGGTTPPTADTVYQTWLFHGPRFQVLTTLLGLDATGVDAMVNPSAAHDMLSGGVAADWLIDPIALDAAPQLAIVWARSNHDVTPLPNRSSRYLRYAPLAGGPVELRVRVAAESSGAMYKADAWFIRDGKLLGHWQGLEGAGSAALNLLMAGAR